jgi:hypothetical protein
LDEAPKRRQVVEVIHCASGERERESRRMRLFKSRVGQKREEKNIKEEGGVW